MRDCALRPWWRIRVRVFVVLYDVSEGTRRGARQLDGVTLGYYRRAKVRARPWTASPGWLYVVNLYEAAA